MLDKSLFKKFSTYMFLAIVVASVTIFLCALVNLVNFATGMSDAKFINIYQMIFSVASILVIAIYITLIRLLKFKTSQLFDCLMMMFLFLLFGIYPCFDLFAKTALVYLLFVIVGFVFSVVSLSVFYYAEREQNGTVKAKTGFLIGFAVLFETFFILVFELVIHFVLKSVGIAIISKTLDCFVLWGFSLIGVAIFVIVCVISLLRDKKFLNLCLCMRISD